MPKPISIHQLFLLILVGHNPGPGPTTQIVDILGFFCLECYVEHFNSVVLTIPSENQNILDAAIEVAFSALLRWSIVFLSHIFLQGITVRLVLERMFTVLLSRRLATV